MSELYEALSQMADRCDNLLAASALPLPPATHLDQCRKALEDMGNQLKEMVVQGTGENPWE